MVVSGDADGRCAAPSPPRNPLPTAHSRKVAVPRATHVITASRYDSHALAGGSLCRRGRARAPPLAAWSESRGIAAAATARRVPGRARRAAAGATTACACSRVLALALLGRSQQRAPHGARRKPLSPQRPRHARLAVLRCSREPCQRRRCARRRRRRRARVGARAHAAATAMRVRRAVHR